MSGNELEGLREKAWRVLNLGQVDPRDARAVAETLAKAVLSLMDNEPDALLTQAQESVGYVVVAESLRNGTLWIRQTAAHCQVMTKALAEAYAERWQQLENQDRPLHRFTVMPVGASPVASAPCDECADWEASFALYDSAVKRAQKAWHRANPDAGDLILPDTAKALVAFFDEFTDTLIAGFERASAPEEEREADEINRKWAICKDAVLKFAEYVLMRGGWDESNRGDELVLTSILASCVHGYDGRNEEDPAARLAERLRSAPGETDALREALEELLPYFEGEHAPDHPSVVKARRALSQHVGGEG